MTERQATDVSPTSQPHDAPSQIDRRGFFRGAAALTVGGFGATTGLAQTTGPSDPAARADGAVSSKSRRPARCAGPGAIPPIGCARAAASTTTSSSSAAARAASRSRTA